METRYLFFFLLVLLIISFDACFTEHEPPIINVTIDNDSVWIDLYETEINFTIEIASDLSTNYYLKKLEIYEGNNVLKIIEFEKNTTFAVEEFQYLIPNDIYIDTVLNFKFVLLDSKDFNRETSIEVWFFEDCGDYPIFEHFTPTLIFNNSNLESWNQSTPFLNINFEDINALNPSSNEVDIDFAFAYDSIYGNILFSPDAPFFETIANSNDNVGWSYENKNCTKLQRVIIPWYDCVNEFIGNLEIMPEYIDDEMSNGIGVSNLQVGEYIAFETITGFKGIIEIKALFLNKKSDSASIELGIYKTDNSGK